MIKFFCLALLILFKTFYGTCQSNQKPNYWIGEQKDGLMTISAIGYFGLMDSLGTVLCSPKYDEIGEFQGNVAVARLNGKSRLINRKGQEVSAIYSSISVFSEGLAAVNLDGKCGFINEVGKEIIPLIYEENRAFSNGLAAVKRKGRWGYINEKGKVIIDFIYSSARNFDRETTIVKRNGSYTIINKKGIEIKVLPYYEVYTNYLESGFLVRDSSGYMGLIDEVGKEIIPCEFDYVSHINFDLFSVSKDRKVGILSSNSKSLADVIYDECFILKMSKVPDSLIIGAKLNGKTGVFNGEGKTILPFNYDQIRMASNKLLIAQTFDRSGFNNSEIFTASGERVGDKKYADASVLSENYILLFNQTGSWSQELIPHGSTVIEHPFGICEVFQLPSYKKIVEMNGTIELFDANTFKVTARSLDESNQLLNDSIRLLLENFSLSNYRLNENHFEWFLCDTLGQAITERKPVVHQRQKFETYFQTEMIDGEQLFGIVNTENVLVTPIFYESILPMQIPNYFQVTKKKKVGVLNRNGEIIVPCIYDEIICKGNCLQSGLIKVRNERNYGLIDLTGEIVIPLEWYDIYDYIYDGKIKVQKSVGNYTVQLLFINKKNEVVIEK